MLRRVAALSRCQLFWKCLARTFELHCTPRPPPPPPPHSDVFTLQYEPAAAEAGAAATVAASSADGGADPELPAPYTCPITHLRCDRHPFAALRPCGHVFSERALKELASGGGSAGSTGAATCPTCGTPYSSGDDVVALFPDGQQLERQRELLPLRRQQQKEQRKKRKLGPAGETDE